MLISNIDQNTQLTNDEKSTLYLNFCFNNKGILKHMLKQLLMYEKNKCIYDPKRESIYLSQFWINIFSVFSINRRYKVDEKSREKSQTYDNITVDTIAGSGDKSYLNEQTSTNTLLNLIKQHNLTNIQLIILSCHKMLQLSLLEFVNSKNNIDHIKVLPTLLNILNIKDKNDLLDLIRSDFSTTIPYRRTSDQKFLYNMPVNTGIIPENKKENIKNTEVFMDNQTQLNIYRKRYLCT